MSPAAPPRSSHHLGHGRLHAERQLVRLDRARSCEVVGILERGEPIRAGPAVELACLLFAEHVLGRRRRTEADSSDRPRAGRRRARGRGSWRRGRPCRRSNRRAACRARRNAAGCRSASRGRSGPTSRSSETALRACAGRCGTASWAPWSLSVVHIERTMARSSTHAADVRPPVADLDAALAPSSGSRSAADRASAMQLVLVRRRTRAGSPSACGDSRTSLYGVSAIVLPAYLFRAGLGSKLSTWLVPPIMNSQMTLLALGGKCGLPSGGGPVVGDGRRRRGAASRPGPGR